MSAGREDGRKTVAVIGAGLSGTLVAANLLRHATRPLRIVLIERSGDFGPGVAYSTGDPQHRLNVPAARMSAFPDAPLHLMTWARRHLGRRVAPGEFLPRSVYGEYLRALLSDERERATAASLELVTAAAERLSRIEEGVAVKLADGRCLLADAAVLATGNLPPGAPPGLPDDPRVVVDPWAPGALDGLAAAATTLVIGTSLTAIDVALTVARKAPAGRTVAISRRGLVPHAHLPGVREPAPAPRVPAGRLPLAALERQLRAHARHMVSEGYDWRDVVDGIRPCVPRLWRRLSQEDRRRFAFDGGAREWDVVRHRVAPEVGAELRELRRAGRLELTKAAIATATARPEAIHVTLAGERGPLAVRADRVVCCAGPGTDIRRGGPLVERLIADGLAVPDALGLGLRTGDCGALADRDGSTRGPIYTLGPPRRGELWETTAAREIRAQAETVALDLCDALGVVRAADESPAESPS